jgi:hypothetical protein
MNSTSSKRCLNLGSGKVDFERYKDYAMTVHVDRSYKHFTSFDIIQNDFLVPTTTPSQYLHQSNIFDFIDSFPYKFDVVFAERIFEHMDYVSGEIGRLLEGINAITNEDAELTIVVPNAILLSKMLLKYERTFETRCHIEDLNTKLILNTEYTNGRFDPHLSVWTPKLAREYIESEGTWKINSIEDQINFAGRDIYMRIICSKT